MIKKIISILIIIILLACSIIGLYGCALFKDSQNTQTKVKESRYFVKIYNTETDEIYVQCSGDVEFEETDTYYIVYDYYDKTNKGTFRYYQIRKTDKNKYVYQKLP